ncbi:MAG: hypothetical protein ACC660_07995, partial [Acidimicrobiales bacterium]
MTAVAAGLAPARSPLDQSWRKLLNYGLILVLAQVFIALSNMPVELDRRVIIEPVLSLGYLSLLWLPIMVGYSVSNETVLEGMTAHVKGAREILAGVVVGVIGGAGLGLLVLLLDNFDIRDPLVNWSPQLLAILSFDNGVSFGVAIWPLIGAGLGLAGGLMQVASPGLR